MLKAQGTTATGTFSRSMPPLPGGAPSVQHTRTRWWILAGLLGLVCASADGLLLAVGVRMRSTPTGTRHGGLARVPASDAGRGAEAGAGASTAGCTVEAGLRAPAQGPGRTESRAEDARVARPRQNAATPQSAAPSDPAPPAITAADRPPRASMLLEPRSRPARPEVNTGDPPAGDVRSPGSELFARKWLPDDPRCHGGDGLGPVYNAASCLDCHYLGAPGGAGPADQNVELATGIGYIPPPGGAVGIPVIRFAGNAALDMLATRPVHDDLVQDSPGLPRWQRAPSSIVSALIRTTAVGVTTSVPNPDRLPPPQRVSSARFGRRHATARSPLGRHGPRRPSDPGRAARGRVQGGGEPVRDDSRGGQPHGTQYAPPVRYRPDRWAGPTGSSRGRPGNSRPQPGGGSIA